ncbi:uncharacterized protein LOC110708920 [Chenopodium quinoa]|uniref:uncharacterized protein LOC110708920 n=1 Tax=Chenopodium quinoa TaxID=63459 RepID=UPI000B77EEAF|nr:uncharacterized protein LOC110708920 [Chenopodium quinoa]
MALSFGRELDKAGLFFEKSIMWDVGNGTSINVWHDRWLLHKSLRDWVVGPIPLSASELSLSHLHLNSRLQLEFQISFPIPESLFVLISSISLSSNPDTSFSDWSFKGRFDSSKARSVLHSLELSAPPFPFKWDLIWKATTYPKVRFFLWLLAWERIPNNQNLHLRLSHFQPFCPFCPQCVESCTHIFITCPRAVEFWDSIKPHAAYSQDHSWRFWLASNLQLSSPHSFAIPWNAIFPAALWHIWLRRNAWLFKKKNIPLSQSINQCIWAASECFFTQNSNLQSLKPPLPAWIPPPPTYLKINCDASFTMPYSPAACAAVCRNFKGEWIEGFSWKSFINSAYDAEMQAIFLSLKWIKLHNWQNVILSTDSKRAVEEIMSDMSLANNPTCLVNCRDLLRELQPLELCFEERTTNAVADLIAKDARRNLEAMDQLCILHSPTEGCMAAFVLDQTTGSVISNSIVAGDVPVNNSMVCNNS